MMQNGVNVSVNSDSGDLIRRLNTEAAKSINYCGMKPEDAIKMVTINPAKQLKVDRYTGSLTEDKHADFVIWSGNPLSIYTKVEQTWIDGRKYFDRAADANMRVALAEEKNKLIQKVLGGDKSSSNGKDSNGKESNGKESNGDNSKTFASNERYLLKEEPAWHCEDNFDFWHWQQTRQDAHSHGQHFQGAH